MSLSDGALMLMFGRAEMYSAVADCMAGAGNMYQAAERRVSHRVLSGKGPTYYLADLTQTATILCCALYTCTICKGMLHVHLRCLKERTVGYSYLLTCCPPVLLRLPK